MAHCVPHDDEDINEFYALYAVHRYVLDGILSAEGAYHPETAEGISDQNYAALALTFQVGEALAELDMD